MQWISRRPTKEIINVKVFISRHIEEQTSRMRRGRGSKKTALRCLEARQLPRLEDSPLHVAISYTGRYNKMPTETESVLPLISWTTSWNTAASNTVWSWRWCRWSFAPGWLEPGKESLVCSDLWPGDDLSTRPRYLFDLHWSSARWFQRLRGPLALRWLLDDLQGPLPDDERLPRSSSRQRRRRPEAWGTARRRSIFQSSTINNVQEFLPFDVHCYHMVQL